EPQVTPGPAVHAGERPPHPDVYEMGVPVAVGLGQRAQAASSGERHHIGQGGAHGRTLDREAAQVMREFSQVPSSPRRNRAIVASRDAVDNGSKLWLNARVGWNKAPAGRI